MTSATRPTRRRFLASLALVGLTGGAAPLVGKRRVTLESFGAVGDGVHDDAPSIRAALAACRPGSTLYGTRGRTYRLATTVVSSAFSVPSGTTTMPYLIAIPDGVTLDLCGATLRTDADAVLVTTTSTAAGRRGTGVGLVRAVLDGAQRRLTNRHLVQIAGVSGLRLDLTVRNVVHGGMSLHGCDHVEAPRLVADGVVGQPFALGYPRAGAEISHSRFGLISASNVTADPADPYFFPGNVVYGEFQRCVIERVVGKDCSAGVKFGAHTSDLAVGSVELTTIGDSVGNTGLKCQGTVERGPHRVHVGRLRAVENAAWGLWLERCVDCRVDSYVGVNNQRSGTGPDVWIGGTRDVVGSIDSSGSGGTGLMIRPYAEGFQLGELTVRDAGRSASATSRSGISVAGGRGTIHRAVVRDTQSRPTMTDGVDVNSRDAVLRIDRLIVSGQRGEPVRLAAGGMTTAEMHAEATGSVGRVMPRR